MHQPPPPPPQTNDYVASNFGMPSSQQPPQGPPLMQPEPAQYPQYAPADTSGSTTAEDAFAFKSPEPFYSSLSRTMNLRYQLFLDSVTPFRTARWAFSLSVLLLFMIRIVVAQGWYVICYGLSIYYLNLFIGFLSPKIDPAFNAAGEGDLDDTGPMLPTRANDEFRPFIRRLPEFKFWLSGTYATLISLFLTLFEVFDLPVFWPILLLYFILLFISTMRQQIKHMIKYGYVPWDKGKKRYGGQKEDPAKFFSTTI